MSKKQVIRINESQLRQIVTESVKRVLNEGIGDEYLDNFGKSVSRSKRFGNVKDLSSWSEEQFDSLNSTRKDMHKKERGVKTKGSTETRDWLRRQTEKGNPIIKYKKNPDEWMKKHLDSVDESKIKKAIKESVKMVLKENVWDSVIDANDKETIEKLENMGWNTDLWGYIDLDWLNKKETFAVGVQFFDYTASLGSEWIPVGNLDDCRAIVESLVKGETPSNHDFLNRLQDCFYSNEEYEDATSVGYEILALKPSGEALMLVADAKGFHKGNYILVNTIIL